MSRNTDQDWRDLADINPYHAVLTDDKWKEGIDINARIEFIKTGANYINEVLATASKLGPWPRGEALDFGCGVGRLVANMAPHADFVTGVDVSTRMVEEAKQNLSLMEVQNTQIYLGNDLEGCEKLFDWINSYIVFQHIPQERGYSILRQMLDKLLPGGVLSLHFTIATDANLIGKKMYGKKFIVSEGNYIRLFDNHNILDDREAVMSMHDYDLTRIVLMLAQAGITRTVMRHMNHKGHHGVLIVGRKK